MDSSVQNINSENPELPISIATEIETANNLDTIKKRGRPRKNDTESAPSKHKESSQTKSKNKDLSFSIEYSSENLFSKFF